MGQAGKKREYLKRRLRSFVVVGGIAGERRRHAAGTTEIAVGTGARTGVGVDGLDLGYLFYHPGLNRLDRHRRDATAGTGATELDVHLPRLTVEVTDGCGRSEERRVGKECRL